MTPDAPDHAIQKALELHQQGQTASALQVLSTAAQQHPADARLHFLVGSLLASQGDYAGAETEMARAATLDATLHIAHFQLGSLRMTGGDGAGAIAAWQPLTALPDEHPLRCFSRGCTALIRDEFQQAEHWLLQGLQAGSGNKPLERDMTLLLQRLRETLAGGAGVTHEPASGESTQAHLLIHGYRDQLDSPPAGPNR